ncbi:MAG: SCP2 sterol-binding domain-containing protein [Candidatus Hodarchaeota archaeon]
MGVGKDAMKEVVKTINANESIKDLFKNWTKIAAYDLEGEDGPFHIIHKADGSCEFKEGAPDKASFTFKTTTELWAQIVKGEKNAQKEFFAKNLKVEGDVMATLKLNEALKKAGEML